MIDLLWDNLPKLIIVFAIYSYLIWIAFFKEGKFKVIKSLEDLMEIILLFAGLFLSIFSVITGLLFLSNLMFGTPLPTDLTSDIQGIIVGILVFTYLPYFIKKDYERRNKKFDIGDWFFMIILINFLILIFGIVNLAYSLLLSSEGAINFFFSLDLFMGFMIFMNMIWLKVVLTNIFRLEKRKYFFNKATLKFLVAGLIISIIGLIIYIYL